MDALPRHGFGYEPPLRDELLALVLDGKKTATCWAAIHGDNGCVIGGRWVAIDGAGADRALLETTDLFQRRFDEMDPQFAYEEGEGPRTLESWRADHTDFFTAEGTFAPDMLLYCERFRVIEILGDGAHQ